MACSKRDCIAKVPRNRYALLARFSADGAILYTMSLPFLLSLLYYQLEGACVCYTVTETSMLQGQTEI